MPNFLIVWADKRSGTSFDIYGTRVRGSGSLLDGPLATGGIAISTASGEQQSAAVAVSGPVLVVWRDRRSTTDYMFGARVGAGGGVQDPSGVAVAACPPTSGVPR